MKNRYYLIVLAIGILTCCNDKDDPAPQEEPFQYIGLKEKTNIRDAQEEIWNKYGRQYHTSIQIIDDYIYVTSSSGIYRKNVKTSQNTEWELYAFKDIPVHQFVKNGNSILAITSYTDERAFIFSSDNGRTYKPFTPPSFFFEERENKVFAHSISQNSKNSGSLVALVAPVGVVKSTDFGEHWEVVGNIGFGYQNWFVGFNPNDTTNLYATGESMIFESMMYSSYDNGKTWSLIETVENNCIHHIAFHPSNPIIMIYSGEYMVKKSVDKGKTWATTLSDEIYFFKTIFDKINPNVVYASGCTQIVSEYNKFTIYRSTDGGDKWEIFFQTNLPGEGGIMDFELYKGNLYLYTYTDGIYKLNASN